MSSFTVDTTTLVALERDPGKARAFADAAAGLGRSIRASAVVVAEFLGSSTPARRRAAEWATSLLEVGVVDEQLARRAAALQQAVADSGASARPSPIDALVAADAEALDAWLIIDGDRAAFRALADASGRLDLHELSTLV